MTAQNPASHSSSRGEGETSTPFAIRLVIEAAEHDTAQQIADWLRIWGREYGWEDAALRIERGGWRTDPKSASRGGAE